MSTNHQKPIRSLRIFTEKLIDYAGLFPPASLDLLQAFHNYVFYLQGEYKWMLAKFIIPAKRLGELTEIMKDMEIKENISLSVLGSGGKDVNEYLSNLKADVAAISNFLSSSPGKITVDAFETRLPADIFSGDSINELKELMTNTSAKLHEILGKNIPVFYEAGLSSNYEQEIIRTVETIASINDNPNSIKCGYKLRTGGVEPSAFPEPEVIAFAIMTCCEFDVPMKCTAGLHHPVRHYNEEVKASMHGFINVFAAGVLAYEGNLDEEELVEILTDEDPYEFIFSEEGIEWNEITISNEKIKAAREKFMISYGSCSFTEPVDDLKTLELF